MTKKLVVVESPFKSNTENLEEIIKHIEYARACLRDCFNKGEYPFASHLIYTQSGVLDDNNLKERKLGINIGFEWAKNADLTVVYTDLGISKGMKQGIENAKKNNLPIEYRKLGPNWKKKHDFIIGKSEFFTYLKEKGTF